MTTTAEYRDGSRILRTGQVVKVRGARGLFRLQGFDTDAGTFDCYGGPQGKALCRTFRLDRLGARPIEANRRAAA